MSKKIRVTTLSGSPYNLGFQHGQAWKEQIHHYAKDRVGLVASGQWSGGFQKSPADIVDLAEQMMPHHEQYAPDLVEEMRGMADAAGLRMGELLIVSGFTDFIDTVYGVSKRKGYSNRRWPLMTAPLLLCPIMRPMGPAFLGKRGTCMIPLQSLWFC